MVHAPGLLLQSKIEQDFTNIQKIADFHTLNQEKPLSLEVSVLMQTDLWHNRHLSAIQFLNNLDFIKLKPFLF